MNEGFDTQEINFTTTGPVAIKDISFYNPDSSFTSGVLTLCVNLPENPKGFTYYLSAQDIVKIDNKRWEIKASPKPGGKNLTGKMEIWINKVSYPLNLKLIAKPSNK